MPSKPIGLIGLTASWVGISSLLISLLPSELSPSLYLSPDELASLLKCASNKHRSITRTTITIVRKSGNLPAWLRMRRLPPCSGSMQEYATPNNGKNDARSLALERVRWRYFYRAGDPFASNIDFPSGSLYIH